MVKPAGPHQGLVEHMGSVGSCNYGHLLKGLDPVHLVEKLNQDPLRNLCVLGALRGDSIYLVKEDYAGTTCPGSFEQVPYCLLGLPDILGEQFRTLYREEVEFGLSSYCLGHHGLAATRRTV